MKPVISPLATPYQFEKFFNEGETRWNDRDSAKIKTIVIHHMAMTDFDAVPEVWREREASAHYGIGPNGEIRAYVGEEKRAWHAKQANADSIGIEICNISKEPNWEVSDKSIDALAHLICDISKRYGIKMEIIGHQFARGNTPEMTECPGPTLTRRLPEIRKKVEVILGHHFSEISKNVKEQAAQVNSQRNSVGMLDKKMDPMMKNK
ncbi:hypothetical protein BH747_03615 [Enterococcus villorum]|uniref:N-acetylmuramoyl-L-alanine amidase n=1 Tax=Enterococcus villorum TaxID=112904 RepID=A0A1V8YMV2_9ENTE|nr:peptidoglycan recognition family protein [Enterococcus villorum]OQO71098.1 hypothetical protein BH747_03615 [Enterococcus villorum]OQO73917.1 hypothetical protein BH744_07940 [Enterococcus villorum]